MLLVVEALRKYFPLQRGWLRRVTGQVRAVDDVSLAVDRGETFALVGESGCGKTTVARAILRLLEPDMGSVRLDGEELTTLDKAALRAKRRHMQIVFQDPYASLNPRITVGEAVSAPMVLHGLTSRAEAQEAARELLVRVGLPARFVSRYPHELSGGQRQRVGIARAIAPRPSLVVADEAVSALDVSVQAQVLNLFLDLQQQLDLGYVFIAHDLAVVRHIADRVGVMYLGRIVEEAPRDALFEAGRHPYTQALLSAIPRVSPQARRERFVLPGEVPSAIHPPAGCPFHPRCPLAWSRCREQVPVHHVVGNGHRVACHLYEEDAEPVSILEGTRS